MINLIIIVQIKKNKCCDDKIVCISNDIFFISSVLLIPINVINSIIICAIGIFSTLHHSNSCNKLYRFFDWFFALSIFIIFTYKYHTNIKLKHIIIVVISLLCWITSLVSWNYKYKSLYNYTHSLWHILICVLFIIITCNI